jgi:HSP20 family molecular chaperone IbpA
LSWSLLIIKYRKYLCHHDIMLFTQSTFDLYPLAELAIYNSYPSSVCCMTKRRAPRSVLPNYQTRTLEEGTIIEVELPGAARDSIELDVQGRSVSLRAVRPHKTNTTGQAERAVEEQTPPQKEGEGTSEKHETSDAGESNRPKETVTPARDGLSYEVRFRIPHDIDVAGVRASFSDGLLTVHVPRQAAAPARRVELSL